MPAVGGYVISYLAGSNQPWKAEIQCYASAAIPPGPQVAAIRFYDTAPPAPGLVGGIPVVNYLLGSLSDVMAILRDETHVSVDKFLYTSAGATISAWGVAGGIAPAAEMQPKYAGDPAEMGSTKIRRYGAIAPRRVSEEGLSPKSVPL